MGDPNQPVGRQTLRLCLDVAREARSCLSAELGRHPGYADLHHLNALLYLSRREFVPAEAALQRALEANPRYAAARASLGHLQIALGHPERAREIFGSLGADDPTGTAGRFGLALVAMAERKFEQAEAGLEECLAQGGRRVPWLHHLGVARNRRGDAAGAVSAWREAAGDQLAGRCYREKGLPAEGPVDSEVLSRLESLIPDHPGLADLEDYFGRIQARAGLWKEAEESGYRAYLLEGDLCRFRMRQGFLAGLKGNDAEALAAYRQAVLADPARATARVALGFEHAAQGDRQPALEQFGTAAGLQPDWPDVQYNLGLLHAAGGSHAEAASHFRAALALHPEYAHAQAGLAFSAFHLGEFEEAGEEFEKALQLGARSSDLLVHLALCHRELGTVNRAVELLNEAVSLNPHDEMAHYHLGFIHHHRGSRRRALAAWHQYLALAERGPLYDEVEARLKSGTDG
jgi:tetratricopeptide (TPR) repeat protein